MVFESQMIFVNCSMAICPISRPIHSAGISELTAEEHCASAANLSAATTVYTSTNEVANTGQYAAGGGVLTGQQTSLDTGVAIVDFNDLSFTGVTLTAAGALIYNTSASNKAVCVLDFGGDKTATAGDFTIIFPTPDASNAIIRIA